ncbi:MAG: hypothetical protein R3C59_11855 [Planctomycetaceae bacterium]
MILQYEKLSAEWNRDLDRIEFHGNRADLSGLSNAMSAARELTKMERQSPDLYFQNEEPDELDV